MANIPERPARARITRRELAAGLGGIAVASTWPYAARAQQGAMPVVGFLNNRTAGDAAELVSAFRRGLGTTGYIEGRNVSIEYRFADNRNSRLPELAADLVRRRVSVIAAAPTVAAVAAKAATSSIPIAFYVTIDPVAEGLVASLNRPGGNFTGVTTLGVELGPKRLELLHEMVPAARVFALMVNPTNPLVAQAATRETQAAAGILGLTLHVLQASTEHEIDAAFAEIDRLGAQGLALGPESLFNVRGEQLAGLALRRKLPTIYQYRDFVTAGGLMSYGGSLEDNYRMVGIYAGQLLKGEKPATLPVQQSIKAELFINLKTAKALGLTVPLSLLGRAEEVIE